jgi:transcriptional regulator with XRE-family HTH domain
MTDTAPLTSSADVAIDGAKLREMRQEQGYTQRVLAEAADMHQSYLSQLENGRRLHVSPPLFVRLCDALKIPADERRTLRTPLSKVA